MTSVRRRLAILLLGSVVSLGILLVIFDPYDLSSYRDSFRFLRASSARFNVAQFSHLAVRPGLTIFGDSYSAGDAADHWHSHVAIDTVQNLAQAGSVVDLTIASSFEEGSRPGELSDQVKGMTFLTEKVVIWFGVNDIMVFFAFWPHHKTAILNELNGLFSLADTLLESGATSVIIPGTIDFTDAPGLVLARPANLTAPREVAFEVIKEWNTLLQKAIQQHPTKNVQSIDFYTLSQNWLTNPTAFGLKSIFYHGKDKSVTAFFWNDFLHVTSWVQKSLFAPQFRAILSV